MESDVAVSNAKKQLTILLKQLRIANKINGEITLRLNDGNVCKIEVKAIF